MSVPVETADARLARMELPVKYEYCRPKSEHTAFVEALATRGGAGARDSVSAPVIFQKKSKNAEKRERAQVRQSKGNICTAYVQKRCHKGDQCKFNHDIIAYFKEKPADLPGECPFSFADSCPYGLMCRWATKHKIPEPELQAFLEEEVENQRKKQQQEKNAEQIHGSQDAAVKNTEETEMAGETAAAAVAAFAKQNNLTTTTSQEEEQNQPEEQHSWWKFDGSIPSDIPLTLPVSTRIAPTMNVLDREIQIQIRDTMYDFTKSDEVLDLLGINNPAKERDEQRKQRGARGGGRGRGRRGGRGGGSEGGNREGEHDVEQPEAKRPRLDDNAVAEAAAAAPSTSDADFLPGVAAPPQTTTTTTAPSPAEETPASISPSLPPPVAAVHTEERKEMDDGAYIETPLHSRERKTLDFRGKTFLAPLTTVGNLPFRRLCKSLGADVTCGEMALATNLLQGQLSEWALLKRHPEEDCFGVQLCGGFGDTMARCAQLIEEQLEVDFVDVNFGCPIDVVINRGAGSACLLRPKKIQTL